MFSRLSKRAIIRIASFSLAALLGLGLFAAVSYGHLRVYRRQTAYDATRAFEETVGGIERLSHSLEKSLYAADGGMCGKVCAAICADARAAETAMAALPFSTVELEQVRGFLGLTGDYAYTLCREAAEQGFTGEQRAALQAMADTAAELAEAVRRMQGDLSSGAVIMDSRERQVVNVGVEQELRKLSGELQRYETAFTPLEPLHYDGRYTAREKAEEPPVDEEEARRLAAVALELRQEELEPAAQYAGQARRSYRSGTRTAVVSAAGLETLTDSRLVSEARLSEEEGQQKAEAFLRRLGYEELRLSESHASGALLRLRYVSGAEDVSHLDRAALLTVALDDGTIYAFDAGGLAGEPAESEWPLSEEEARALLPEGLEAESARKVTLKSAGGRSLPCWELTCADAAGKSVTLYLNAETGKQQEIRIA